MHNIINYFEEIVLKYPNCIAVVEGEQKYTYKQLDAYANYLSNRILERAETSDKVGIYMNRSVSLIASILAVLKSGKAYVPLDINYPSERIMYMIDDSQVEIVICDRKPEFMEAEKILLVENLPRFEKMVNEVKRKNEVAYIIYTSGTMGKPKGVIVNHESILNTLIWRIGYYHLTSNDVVLQIPSCSFSSSIEDIFSTLLSGGRLIMIQQNDLVNMKKMSLYIKKYEVTHILLVPTLYNQLVRYLDNSKLRFVVVAGEAVTEKIIDLHYSNMPNVALYCEYGMSETSVAFSACYLAPGEKRRLIGKPISNMEYELIGDKEDSAELIVIGVGVADGYTNCMLEDKKRFGEINGKRTFSTGDFVKLDKDGELVFCGRKDKQIKINGKRFDLAEIDTVLMDYYNVLNVVSTVLDDKTILTFVEAEDFPVNEAMHYLKEKIPKDFIPKYVEVVPQFSKLPNGKIDIKLMKEIFRRK